MESPATIGWGYYDYLLYNLGSEKSFFCGTEVRDIGMGAEGEEGEEGEGEDDEEGGLKGAEGEEDIGRKTKKQKTSSLKHSSFRDIEAEEYFLEAGFCQLGAQLFDLFAQEGKVKIVRGVLTTGRGWKFFRIEPALVGKPKMIYEGGCNVRVIRYPFDVTEEEADSSASATSSSKKRRYSGLSKSAKEVAVGEVTEVMEKLAASIFAQVNFP